MRLLGALLMITLIGAPRQAAADEDTSPQDCAAPARDRPPDPRCGETLDGRAPPQPSAALAVPRAALWIPRYTSRALFWPVVQVSDVVEANHVPDWLDAILTSDDGLVGVRPVVNYATGFLPSAGLRFFYRRLPGQGSALGAHFQTAGSSVLLGEITASAPVWTGLSLRLMFNRRNDRLFAGIGPLSAADLADEGHGQARFASDIFFGELRWTRPLPAHFGLVLHGDLQRRDYSADGVHGGPPISDLFRLSSPACDAGTAPASSCVDPTLVPGFQNGLRIVHAGSSLVWDRRRRTRDGSGVSASLDATVGQGIDGDPSRHAAFSGETTLALGGTDRVIIVRGRATTLHRLGAAPIPFEELVSPAGNAGMRGFAEGRFRGESGVVGTAEYRWYVSHDIDASLFSDVGTVAGPSFAGLGDARWFPSFGVGLRLYSNASVYWEDTLDSGVQIMYAPDGGFRVVLAVATF